MQFISRSLLLLCNLPFMYADCVVFVTLHTGRDSCSLLHAAVGCCLFYPRCTGFTYIKKIYILPLNVHSSVSQPNFVQIIITIPAKLYLFYITCLPLIANVTNSSSSTSKVLYQNLTIFQNIFPLLYSPLSLLLASLLYCWPIISGTVATFSGLFLVHCFLKMNIFPVQP